MNFPLSFRHRCALFGMRAVVFIVLLAMMLTCCACSGEERPENADQTILFHLEEDPASLDPQVASTFGARVAVEALYEGLVRLDEDGTPYPGAAESWTVSDDGRVYTFHIREDAQWSRSIVEEDGEKISSSTPAPLTAQDFVYAWQRAVNPVTGCPDAASFSNIQNASQILAGKMDPSQLGVTAQDEHTLVVTLENPSEDFLALTASTAFMPCQEEFFLWTSGRYGLEAKYVCGNGPFVFNNNYAWDHEEGMSMKRSSSYQGDKEPLPASLKLYTSTEAIKVDDPLTAISEQTVDLIELPGELVENAQDEEEYQIITLPMDAVWGLCFNTEDDLLKNADIRRVFVQTLNRETLIDNLPEQASPASDIIPSTFLWNGESYREQAGSDLYLRQDNSVLDGLSGLLQDMNLDTMPSITVLGTQSAQEILNQMLITWNGRMGNYFNLETMSESDLTSKVKKGEYQAAVCALRPEGDTPMSLLSLFSSENSDNPAHLKSASYDQLLETASNSTSVNDIVQAEKWLNQQAVFYPLYYTDRYYLANPTLTGVVIHSLGRSIDFIQAGKLE